MERIMFSFYVGWTKFHPNQFEENLCPYLNIKKYLIINAASKENPSSLFLASKTYFPTLL
jgi:hypothetical protein